MIINAVYIANLLKLALSHLVQSVCLAAGRPGAVLGARIDTILLPRAGALQDFPPAYRKCCWTLLAGAAQFPSAASPFGLRTDSGGGGGVEIPPIKKGKESSFAEAFSSHFLW